MVEVNYGEYQWPFQADNISLNVNVTEVSSDDDTSQLAEYIPKYLDGGNTASGYETNAKIALYTIGLRSEIPGCNTGYVSQWGGGFNTTGCSFIYDKIKYALYYRYIMTQDKIEIQRCSTDKSSLDGATYLFKNSPTQWCQLAVKDAAVLSDAISVVGSNGRLTYGTYKDILEWMTDESSYNLIPEENYAEGEVNDDGEIVPDPVEDDTDPAETAEQDACYKEAESLGWVLCPVISGMSRALGSAYDKYVEPFLVTDSEFFKPSSAVEKAWSTFRDLANIVFAV